ncbi:methyltransferase domain-containing protein [Balneolaceae bacterium YR4-1]|uniref:Methyltransferase domain-containing protein n=1 Tax=Halalkalibaculum roseum TaxID=2709311 RepID=A0A6M1T5S7_9BACT|nr:methyltransferase domain-containing protein [Halalkalibaculum roseum]NGP78127.1 methyltransferase domain-containing protein [Halalkalibaculum roseum]
MPFFLKDRDEDAQEKMDDPNCDKEKLFNTYKQFSVINGLISGWRSIYKNEIRPACNDLSRRYSLLDIGFGGGDLALKLADWTKSDQIGMEITAIETDERAYEYVKDMSTPPNITFRQISSTALREEGQSFDFVISNHLLHHLNKGELLKLLDESKELSQKKVLFSDIERSDLGYLLFNTLSRPIFNDSFITEDGLTSIKRSYTASELKSTVPPAWKVKRKFPYRLLLRYEH